MQPQARRTPIAADTVAFLTQSDPAHRRAETLIEPLANVNVRVRAIGQREEGKRRVPTAANQNSSTSHGCPAAIRRTAELTGMSRPASSTSKMWTSVPALLIVARPTWP